MLDSTFQVFVAHRPSLKSKKGANVTVFFNTIVNEVLKITSKKRNIVDKLKCSRLLHSFKVVRLDHLNGKHLEKAMHEAFQGKTEPVVIIYLSVQRAMRVDMKRNYNGYNIKGFVRFI